MLLLYLSKLIWLLHCYNLQFLIDIRISLLMIKKMESL